MPIWLILLIGLADTIILAEQQKITSTEVVYFRTEAATERGHIYQVELLELALRKTEDDFGKYTLKPSSYEANQKRGIQNLEARQGINLLWGMTDRDREARLLPIKIPLFKGLFGLRVCLVKKGQADRFKAIKTVQDWISSDLIIGQGEDWPDTKILQLNELKVLTSRNYGALFKMTARGRIDCFARSVLEAKTELKRFELGNIELDHHLLFQYRAPLYFFVNKEDVALARRIETGLKRAIKDGSFDEVFYGYHVDSFEGLNLDKRTVIALPNPHLEDIKVLDNPALWFDFDSIKQGKDN